MSTQNNASQSSGLLFQRLIALATIGLAVVWGIGAAQIPSEAGYAGIGANFVPWVVSLAVGACGLLLLWETMSGGFRHLDAPSGSEKSNPWAFALVSAGILLNAYLIERTGFIISCALCFALAVRGIRAGQGRGMGGIMQLMLDFALGICLAAPIFWLFTKGLNVNLPGLTTSGWL